MNFGKVKAVRSFQFQFSNMLKVAKRSPKIFNFLVCGCVAIGTTLSACGENPTESGQASEQPVRVGVLIINDTQSTQKQYQPLLEYLEKQTSRDFEFVPINQINQFELVRQGNLDFVVSNPLASVQLRRLYDTEFLATYNRPQTGSEFGGLIIVDGESDINTIEDLQGKSAACVNFLTAAAGCVFQIDYLQQQGIDPFADFSSFTEIPSQEKIVTEVVAGNIDVGFVRTGQLEKMIKEGTLTADEVKVVQPVQDNFLYQHTTDLYPEWAFAALDSTDPQLVTTVKDTLINLPVEHQALEALQLNSFVPAVDYGELDRLIYDLKLVSWQKS